LTLKGGIEDWQLRKALLHPRISFHHPHASFPNIKKGISDKVLAVDGYHYQKWQ
jgi:hypothetical protein